MFLRITIIEKLFHLLYIHIVEIRSEFLNKARAVIFCWQGSCKILALKQAKKSTRSGVLVGMPP